MVCGFAPVFDARSRILILGTMPSPRSRALSFYYMHPQNRFWPVLCAVLGKPLPADNAQRAALLLENRIALWDVLARCDIEGASDQSIKNPERNDLQRVLEAADIRAVFTTGMAAARLYTRFWGREPMPPHIALPSTSPANCRLSAQALEDKYQLVLQYLKD